MTVTVDYRTEVLSFTQAAITCGVTARTMRRWADEGHVPTVLLPNGRRAILESDLSGAVVRTHHRVRPASGPMQRGRRADRSLA